MPAAAVEQAPEAVEPVTNRPSEDATDRLDVDGDVTLRVDTSFRARLVCREPRVQPKEVHLRLGKLTVGRPSRSGGPAADILIHHTTISRMHAELICSADENGDPFITVRDIGSTNGTTVNSRRIGDEPVEVSGDDEIAFGEVPYHLRIRPRR
jgi:pSer/pThr/pTyr-binding forkhead associated (FHA) protein